MEGGGGCWGRKKVKQKSNKYFISFWTCREVSAWVCFTSPSDDFTTQPSSPLRTHPSVGGSFLKADNKESEFMLERCLTHRHPLCRARAADESPVTKWDRDTLHCLAVFCHADGIFLCLQNLFLLCLYLHNYVQWGRIPHH